MRVHDELSEAVALIVYATEAYPQTFPESKVVRFLTGKAHNELDLL